MQPARAHLSYRPLRTPKAAAFAGIAFAVLQITSYYLMQSSIPAESLDAEGLARLAQNMSLGLSLLPFAGIAFLWFLGVLRDRLGHLEDQFFSTLFFGSGLLYEAMTFISAAIVGGLLTVYAVEPNLLFSGAILPFGQAIVYKFNNVYAIRMAGMFMMVLGTIWVFGHHLGADRPDAALAGLPDLRDCAIPDCRGRLLAVVDAFLPNLGLCNQRLYPGIELPLQKREGWRHFEGIINRGGLSQTKILTIYKVNR